MYKFLLAILLLSMSFAQAQDFQIGKRTENLSDPSRNNRPVPTEVYYPAVSSGVNTTFAEGKFPLIVFAHGFLMSYESYGNISDFFVPKGYIVAFCNTENGFLPSHNDYGLDLIFIAQKMAVELNENTGSFWYDKFSNKKAVMGHSLGGGASMLAASGNSIFDLVVGVAPAETSPSSSAAAALINAPLLIIAGTEDMITAPDLMPYPIYSNANTSVCKTYINIVGAGHCYFANPSQGCDLAESTPSLTRAEQHKAFEDFSITYFETFLKNNSSGWQAFTDSLNSSARILFEQNCGLNILSDGVNLSNKTTVFPNPAYDVLFIKNDNFELRTFSLFDVNGRKQVLGEVNKSEDSYQLNLGQIESGVYFLVIQDLKGYKTVKKVLIQ